jgi:hypothetical protein
MLFERIPPRARGCAVPVRFIGRHPCGSHSMVAARKDQEMIKVFSCRSTWFGPAAAFVSSGGIDFHTSSACDRFSASARSAESNESHGRVENWPRSIENSDLLIGTRGPVNLQEHGNRSGKDGRRTEVPPQRDHPVRPSRAGGRARLVSDHSALPASTPENRSFPRDKEGRNSFADRFPRVLRFVGIVPPENASANRAADRLRHRILPRFYQARSVLARGLAMSASSV